MGDINNKEQNVVYLSLLEKSLEKKAAILEQLIELTEEQKTLIDDDKLTNEQFDDIFDKKGELIKQINELDNGFEQLYQRVRDELNANPGGFKMQIEQLKKLITDVTDKGVRLQASERRNKERIDSYLRNKRESIKNFKVNSKAASRYYSNINNATIDNSYFFDKKK